MLSRIAEALFWIGRYVERADDTARILDVWIQRILEDPWVDESLACRSLLAVMGSADPPDPATTTDVLDRLAFQRDSPGSIAGALFAARENARGTRETISTELWECLNTTWNDLPAERRAAERLGPHSFLRYVKERSAMVAGLAESTMSHDDGWRFLVLGRSLERIDMTTRLLSTRIVAGESAPSWRTLLRSCGADESFLRTYRGAVEAEHVAEFLLLDRLFPRSVFHALTTAESCLSDLDPGLSRAGVGDPARRIIGRARTGLEYLDSGQLLDELPTQLASIQEACHAAAGAVADRYFQYAAPVAWLHESG